MPQERTVSWKDQSALTEEILQHWATQELPDWQEEGKVKAPKDKWVIISAGGQAVPRTHERWHLMDGKI